jgi:hypothetical protein
LGLKPHQNEVSFDNKPSKAGVPLDANPMPSGPAKTIQDTQRCDDGANFFSHKEHEIRHMLWGPGELPSSRGLLDAPCFQPSKYS